MAEEHTKWLLMIDGYIRQHNETWDLIIPAEINTLISEFSKITYREFDKFDKKILLLFFRISPEQEYIYHYKFMLVGFP